MEFTDLHSHSVYSLRDGYSTIPEKIERAKELGYTALAMTEHGTTTGLMDLYLQCKKADLKPILGYEGYFSFEPEIKGGDTYHILLIATNWVGYRNLLEISDYGTEHFYYKPRIGIDCLRRFSEGIICSTACIGGVLRSENYREVVDELHGIFGDNFYLEIQPHDMQDQIDYNNKVVALHKETGIPLLVTGDSHYARPEDDKWHRAFLELKPDEYHLDKDFWLKWHIEHGTRYGGTSTKTGTLYKDLDQEKIDQLWEKERHYVYYASHDFHMMSRDEMKQKLIYLDQDVVEEGLNNVTKIINQCDVEIPTGGENFPVFDTKGTDIVEHIKALCRNGWRKYNINQKPNKDEYLSRFLMEMDMLNRLHYLNYFAILADMIQHCKDSNIPVGLGRGSVGGSLVAFLCGITEVDPVEYDLVFERFANPERVTLPDIDTDLSTEKRGQVIDYVKEKYGEVFNVRTLSNLQDKGAVVKAATYLGLSYAEAAKLSKNINSVDDLPDGEIKEYAKHFVGRLDAYGKHASAVAVFPRKHTEWCSVEKQKDTMVAAQDFHIMEKQGLLKLDLLGLTTLDIIDECVGNIDGGVDLRKIDYADLKTAQLLRDGHTDGVFQIESQTMTGLVQGIKVKDVRDLSAVVALGRPAILDMGLEQTFIKRRNGDELVEYKDPKLQPILEETEGLMLYQEQVMKVVQVMCGYSLGEADNVRRVIGRKIKEDVAEIKADIIERGVKLGTPRDIMEALGNEVEAFAAYGFNKCLSGDTVLDRNYRSQNKPLTISEMFKTMNDRKWAYENKHGDLYHKYRSQGYGKALSMFKDRIKPNNIVNIYYSGKRPVWKVTLHNGATIKATSNHSFITKGGKKLLCELTTDDFLPTKGDRYKPKYDYSFHSDQKNSKKGHRGFVATGGPSVDFDNFRARHQGEPCEICGKANYRMEAHHINMDRSNNSDENLMWLCPSCHKKEHYKIGRAKRGENGYCVDYVQIIDISFVGFEDTYDVEMADPAHNLVTSTGIVTCNSHSMAYAMTAWRCAYLKAHYPTEFMAAVLNANRDDKEQFSYYISSCQKFGIEILPPSITKSKDRCVPEGNAIRLGFSVVAGIKNKEISNECTDAKQYIEEHSNYNKTVLEGLVKSGALDECSNCSRSELLEYIVWAKDKRKSRPAFSFSGKESGSDGLMEFSVLGYAFTDVFTEFDTSWVPNTSTIAIITSVKAHKTRKGKPMAFIKADIKGKGVTELVIFDERFKELEKGKCYALTLRDTIINDFLELKKKK